MTPEIPVFKTEESMVGSLGQWKIAHEQGHFICYMHSLVFGAWCPIAISTRMPKIVGLTDI